ncbi:HAMP domain-containing sensor histidine kinase [Paenibacillus sp. FSL W8-0187]|uniref:HAMP domain-containing sensor histidine kinase n=1 Tax=unclassified Paenibacillus TaxID=185978 RepID=UPI0030D7745F
MKDMPKYIFLLLLVVPLLLLISIISPGKSEAKNAQTVIPDWQFMWDDEQQDVVSPVNLQGRSWLAGIPDKTGPPKSDGVYSAWNRFTLPALPWKHSAIMIDRIKGQDVLAFLDNEQVYEAKRDYMYTSHSLLLPIHPDDAGKTVYIWTNGVRDMTLGIDGDIILGEYEHLRGSFIKNDLEDFILGSSFLFIAVVMFFCCLFLPKHTVSSWLSLSVIILASGAMLITYSPFLYTFYGDLGNVWVAVFDISLFAVLPALYYYFEKIYGSGPYRVIRYCRRFQIAYSIMCLIFLVAQVVSDHSFHEIYYLVSVKILGILIILQMLLLVGTTILYASKRNKDAYIFSVGFGMMALAALGDLLAFYYHDGQYHFFLWKWGIIGLIVSLIVMLGRKFVRSHEQVLQYSRKLEMFNNELQRSEKMEIISELAASVAHEVRNPLQVTRGFMQLLAQNSKQAEKEYFGLALKELDRASGIITDFLTFAKPELENEVKLNVYEELKHVKGILLPLANLSGGTIELDVAKELYMTGNSSKLKQAMINIVKNSIEALDGEGVIRIWAYAKGEEVVIHIKDDGIGMDAADLERLGEAYFSNKSKGTGLGLMVTFRIIEAMHGTIHFVSEKGSGTEAIIRFPAVPALQEGEV